MENMKALNEKLIMVVVKPLRDNPNIRATSRKQSQRDINI
jgi:hypothetical protein